MSSVIAFEPYVVRTGRGDPFVQNAMYGGYRGRWGLSLGPDFTNSYGRGVSSIAFSQ
ncbi:MAG: hypothetical protein QXE51_04030 [Nitrososphaeria archaeon]